MMRSVCVVIPAYKPGDTLIRMVQELQADGYAAIVVVNDGSGPAFDPVFQAVSQLPGVALLRHAVNLGKGAALKTGLNYVGVQHPGLAAVTADADGQHLPRDIRRVAERCVESDALVLGVRDVGPKMPLRSRVGNQLTVGLVRLVVGQTLEDTQTGLRGIPHWLIPHFLRLTSNGYEFELDMLMTCKHLGYRLEQIPIETVYLNRNESSHFNPFFDSMRIYFVLFRFALTSFATAIIDNLVFAGLYAATSHILLSQVASRGVALIFNYVAARSLVFLSYDPHKMVFPKYVTLVVLSGTASYMLIRVLAESLGISVISAKLIAEGLLFLLNFAVQRDWVFTSRRRPLTGATDWTQYYRAPVATARFSRRYTQSVLVRLLQQYGRDASGSVGVLVELGGANSCFLDGILREVRPREYHVLDNNEYGLDLLRRRTADNPSVRADHGDVLALDAHLEADVVFSVGLIEHFDPERTRRAVQAHFALLKPGGVAIITFPTPTLLYRCARGITESLGMWRFPDERPLSRAEVVDTVLENGELVEESLLWPIVFTQRVLVVRKTGGQNDRQRITTASISTK